MIYAFDTETELITPGILAPPLVCLSWSIPDTEQADLLARADGVAWVRDRLRARDTLVSHNASFDFGVVVNEAPDLIADVFDAYREGRAICTIVRQELIDIALGMRKFRRSGGHGEELRITKATYGLADLVAMYYGERLEKEDTWRLSYGLLQGIPIERWPEQAVRYAIFDAVEHGRVYLAQDKLIHEVFEGDLPNQVEQQRAAWALHLMSMWGVRADEAQVDRFYKNCEEHIEGMREALLYCEFCSEPRDRHPQGWCAKSQRAFQNTGIMKEDGSRTMAEIKRRVVADCEARGVQVPYTPKGNVITDKETLQATNDPALHVLAEQMTYAKHLGQWGPVCRAAVSRPVLARYEVLVETGRTACSGSEGQEGTNFQNPPRKGDVRPCFIPRPGYLYCSTDADTIELRALAQCLLEMVGWSRMAEALWDQYKNKGPDLHVRLAAQLINIDAYEAERLRKEGDAEVLEARQTSKPINFGCPGGLGPETLVAYAAAQLSKALHRKWFGVERGEQIAKSTEIRETWFATWPEMRDYFSIVGKMIDPDSRSGVVQQLMSGRIRGDVRFTAAANTFFQGRVADAMKEAVFHLADECYTGRCATRHAHGGSHLCTVQGRSILEGSRGVMFLHDEPILEHPEDGSESDRAERQRQIVVEHLNIWMPDIPCTSQAVLMRRWYKGAEPVHVGGLLVPSRPETYYVEKNGEQVKKTRWLHDEPAKTTRAA